jgi:hypothetical protein
VITPYGWGIRPVHCAADPGRLVARKGANRASHFQELVLDLSRDLRGSDAKASSTSRANHGGMNNATSVHHRGCGFYSARWYAVCIASGMLNMLTAPALTLLFLIIVICLGAAFVWMFWEIEQRMSKSQRMAKPYRKSDRSR